VWAVAHVWFLISWRNCLVIALNWLWNYVTLERGARLIAGSEEAKATGEIVRLAA
jgi:NADH dehydrogenase